MHTLIWMDLWQENKQKTKPKPEPETPDTILIHSSFKVICPKQCDAMRCDDASILSGIEM